MKMRDVYKILVGGSVVYLALAACTASEHGRTPSSGASSGSGITDPVPNANADPTSGSRLKAKYRTSEDGSKEYLSGIWYDSNRKEDCQFATASDGKERCLPIASTSLSYYSDDACTQWIASASSADCAPKYGMTFEQATCGAASVHIFPVGAKTMPAKLYVKSGSSCLAAGSPDPAAAYFALGAELGASAFVESSVQHD